MAETTCAVEGCYKVTHARGWCPGHYQRWRQDGDVGAGIELRAFRNICEIPGCGRKHHTGGYCNLHYKRWQAHGDPTKVIQPPAIQDRFWVSVDTQGPCWEWTATRNHHGYGHAWLDGRLQMAHRIAYELLVDRIDSGLELDHLCRNPPCVNPDHLQPVTHAENMLRAPWGAVQYQASKTHCPQGHEYTPENTYIRKSKYSRECRTCRVEASRLYRERKRRAAL